MSGVISAVVTFFGLMWTVDSRSVVLLFIILIGVPALGTRVWRYALGRSGRERDQAKLVAWQAFRVLLAWETLAIVLEGFFLFFVFSAMAPVPHSHHTAGVIALITIPAITVLVIWFTWVRSRRILDLLFPLPGMPQPGSESPYLQLRL